MIATSVSAFSAIASLTAGSARATGLSVSAGATPPTISLDVEACALGNSIAQNRNCDIVFTILAVAASESIHTVLSRLAVAAVAAIFGITAEQCSITSVAAIATCRPV